MTENDEKGSPILGLVEINEDTQENDDDKPDREMDCHEEKHVFPDLIEENCIVGDASNEEDKVMDPKALMSPEQSLHKEVMQSFHEQQDEISAQVSEKVFLDEILVDEGNVIFEYQEPSEVYFLMIDELNEAHHNQVVLSYEEKYIQTVEDQRNQNCHSESSSYVSCLEMFSEEEINSSACL